MRRPHGPEGRALPACFLVRWLCGGAWSWLPGDWPLGLLTAVHDQAAARRTCGPLTWETRLQRGTWPVRVGLS